VIGWRWSNAPLEVVANLRANRVRNAIVGLFCAVASGVLFFAEMTATQSSVTTLRALEAAGRSVYVVEPSTETGVPLLNSETCDGLVRLPQVRASGGLTFSGFVDFKTAPGTPFRLFLATGSFARVVDPDSVAPSSSGLPTVMVARQALFQAGLKDGEAVSFVNGTEVAVHSFDPVLRHPLGALMVVAPRPPGLVEQCWFELRDADLAEASAVAQSAFVQSELRVSVRSAQDTNEFTTDPVRVFEQRSSRFGWLVLGFVMAVPLLVVAWLSRQQSAIYRSLYASRTAVLAIVAGEAVAVIVWGAAVGSAVALAVADQGESVEAASALVGLSAVCLAVALAIGLAIGGVSMTTRGQLTDQLKDR